jgi:hypothetical protein
VIAMNFKNDAYAKMRPVTIRRGQAWAERALNFDVRRIWINTDVTISGDINPADQVDIDPWVVSTSIAFDKSATKTAPRRRPTAPPRGLALAIGGARAMLGTRKAPRAVLAAARSHTKDKDHGAP